MVGTISTIEGFALDLAHELPLTICTQQDKCLSQPLLTVIAVDRESDVLSSGYQSRPRRRKWLVCPELGKPFLCSGYGVVGDPAGSQTLMNMSVVSIG